jgi:hypothetical protein
MKLLSAIGLLLLAAACGSGQVPLSTGNGRPAIDPSDPCSLLTSDQVAGVLGLEVREAREIESIADPRGNSVPLCRYQTEKPYRSVTLYVESPASESEFKKNLGRDPVNTTQLEGIGDLAFVHAGVQLATLVQGTVISVTVQDFDTVEETEVVLRKIAQAAVRELLD